MEQPYSYVDSRFPKHVCYVQRILYDLKQAPRTWFTHLRQFLQYCGFTNAKSNFSLFVFHNNCWAIPVLIYVDDFIITSSDTSKLKEFILKVCNQFQVRGFGNESHSIQNLRHSEEILTQLWECKMTITPSAPSSLQLPRGHHCLTQQHIEVWLHSAVSHNYVT